jgi:hypothetical protein
MDFPSGANQTQVGEHHSRTSIGNRPATAKHTTVQLVNCENLGPAPDKIFSDF